MKRTRASRAGGSGGKRSKRGGKNGWEQPFKKKMDGSDAEYEQQRTSPGCWGFAPTPLQKLRAACSESRGSRSRRAVGQHGESTVEYCCS